MSKLPDFEDDDAWAELAEEAIEAALKVPEAPHSGVTAERTEEN